MQHHGRVEGQDHQVLQGVAKGPGQVRLRQVPVPAGAGRGGEGCLLRVEMKPAQIPTTYFWNFFNQ